MNFQREDWVKKEFATFSVNIFFFFPILYCIYDAKTSKTRFNYHCAHKASMVLMLSDLHKDRTDSVCSRLAPPWEAERDFVYTCLQFTEI